ncbi:MAG TPA: AzlD domain-containing protein [Anaerolineaceae bacterium]|nr:AzlD domain-containing protein [Anaerolineaceae bacterium]
MDQKILFLTILGMLAVTYLPRLLPVWLLSGRKLPAVVETWLRYVPAAVLAALLVPGVVVADGALNLSWNNLYLLALAPTLLVAWKTRSLFGAVVVGMALVAVGRYFL